MQKHIDQASHNQKFHDSIDSQFGGEFYDWKITVLFYVAIHYLKALASKKGMDIGDTHHEIEYSVNPDRVSSKMKITRTAWREYKNLFNYSRTSRYEGITDFETFEKLKQLDHSYCIQHLENFKNYLRSQDLPI